MNANRIVGVVCLAILFMFSLYGSILYGSPYPLVGFFVLLLVGVLLTRTLFRKERQLYKKGKTEEMPQWNMYLKLMLFILVGYPLLLVPRYLTGTPLTDTLLKRSLAAYAALVVTFGAYGILLRIFFLNKGQRVRWTATLILIILASLGACALTLLALKMIGWL
jgi:hypothetical protein